MSAESADLKQAWQLYYAKKYQDSNGLCEKLLQEQPQDMFAQCLLYRCRYRMGETEAVEQWLAQVFTQDQACAPAYELRGFVHGEKKEHDAAIRDCNEAIRLDPQYAMAHNNRGSAYKNEGDNDAAIRDYSQAIRLDPQYTNAYFNRGNAYDDKGDYDAAIRDYSEAIRLDPQDAIAYYNRGNAYDDKGDYDAAIRDYSESLRLDPQYTNAYFNRGNAYKAKGDLDAAIRDYSEAIRLDPQDAIAYYNRGNAYKAKGDHDAAIRDYNEAIRLNPQYAVAYNNRGNAYDDKGDYDAAIRDYSEAIRLDPQHTYAYGNLKICYNKLNNPGKTLSVIAHQSQLAITTYENKDTDIQYWNDAIVHHLKSRVLPAVKQSNTRFVHYWHVSIRWGARTSQSIIVDGNTSFVHQGSYGAGYLALTERDLYIVNLGEISRRFMNKRGLLGKAFLLMLRNMDMTRRETSDLVFTFPHTDIYSLSKQGDSFVLNTGSQTWELSPFFNEDANQLYMALSLAREHKVSSLFEPLYESKLAAAPSAAAASTDEVFQAIEKLKNLLDRGAVTQEEFEEKKKELLARI